MAIISSAEHLASLRSSIDFFQSQLAVARQTADAPVPSCPGWGVADLYRHLGSVQSWVLSALQLVGSADRPAPRSRELDTGRDAFADFVASAPELLDRLQSTDPELSSWNFGPPPRLAAFWFRRQNMEHLVHAEDLAQALGVAAPDIPEQLALDGVDEVLSVLVPQRVRAGLVQDLNESLAFESAGRHWQLGTGEPSATLSAEPNTLFLGLWRRRPLLELASLKGESQQLSTFLESDLVP